MMLEKLKFVANTRYSTPTTSYGGILNWGSVNQRGYPGTQLPARLPGYPVPNAVTLVHGYPVTNAVTLVPGYPVTNAVTLGTRLPGYRRGYPGTRLPVSSVLAGCEYRWVLRSYPTHQTDRTRPGTPARYPNNCTQGPSLCINI